MSACSTWGCGVRGVLRRALPDSVQVQAALSRLGQDIRVARKRRRLSVADFCARIGVTDKTLANLERGSGGVRIEILAMALLALGELHRLEGLLDPARDETGVVLDTKRLPQRIRQPGKNRRREGKASGKAETETAGWLATETEAGGGQAGGGKAGGERRKTSQATSNGVGPQVPADFDNEGSAF